MSLLETVRDKAIAAIITVAIPGAVYAVDKAGWTPVTQNQRQTDSFYQKRDRLLDRVEDKSITEFQRGVLYGLCAALNIKTADCEKREN